MSVLHTDNLVGLRMMADNSMDSVVTDPPYELTGARPGGRSPATEGAVMKGFMGMEWDGSGVAYSVELWREVLRVLKPGGHMLAFGGSRTYHRMACAIEDAGFEIRDQIMWVYGSGFPKSHNGEWGGTALKPAHEPICVARKPLIGTVETNWRAHGTGALNIERCRVPFIDDDDEAESKGKNQHGQFGSGPTDNRIFGKFDKDRDDYNPPGRWPANVIHDGSASIAAGFPQSSVTGARSARSKAASVEGTAWLADNHQSTEYTDGGSTSRFFYCAKASKTDRDAGLSQFEARVETGHRKTNLETADRPHLRGQTARLNTHPTVKPNALMRYLVRLVTPAGGIVLDIFAGSGSTGVAAKQEGFYFIGFEQSDEYAAIANARIEAANA